MSPVATASVSRHDRRSRSPRTHRGWPRSGRGEERKKQDEEKARAELETQADLFASTIMAARIAGRANDRCWNGTSSVIRAVTLAAAQLLPALTQPGGTITSAFAARAAWLIAYMDGPRNRAVVEVTTVVNKAISGAMPLARHTNPAVAEATDAFLNGLLRNASEQTMSSFRVATDRVMVTR
jgi:hypothetical protein